ncbi:GNAT family N-acetyltransferase [Candidatus Fermentibacteria bacterium]|nr:GNAT family N-acetyltransferase [Candidatus Fermentibacteria bacterium]
MLFPELRLGRPADIDRLTGLDARIFPWGPWPRAAFAQTVLPRRDSRTLLALSDGRIAGYCCASLEPEGILHLTNLAVIPEWRRKGLGSLLTGEMETWGARRSCSSVMLEVRKGDTATIRFYDSLGYLREGTIERYYGSADAVVMGRQLEVKNAHEEKLGELSEAIAARLGPTPPVGLVLGSGLSWLVESAGIDGEFDIDSLPHMHGEKLPGHPGRIAVSRCGSFLFLMGRRHRYQGFDPAEISLLPSALSDLGTCTWILTSSAGGLLPEMDVGTAVVFEDHINLTGSAHRMTCGRCGGSVYSADLRSIALECAEAEGADLRAGVFAYVTGPAYETRSEVALLRSAGASMVSMSTVPEALALAELGCSTIALALVANSADGANPVSHEEVLAAQPKIRKKQEGFLLRLMDESLCYARGEDRCGG